MNSIADLSPADLKRIPGLFRRWELTEVFEPHRNYQIEDAGAHSDGTPLLAVFFSEALSGVPEHCETRPLTDMVDPRSIIPPGLMPAELVSALPLITETPADGDDLPTLKSLFAPQGSTVSDLYLDVIERQRALVSATRTERALAMLLDRLIAHGAAADTYVGDALKNIAPNDAQGV